MRTLVYIVGAGPGDPGLISVRGLQCLERADVVVHDRRVPPGLLAQVPPGAERIEVGAAVPSPLDQDAVSSLVAGKAREGKVVVRLKWGDPLVFGGGAKEAMFLDEHGIPFEIVPGIPAAVASAAYAGVPIACPPDVGDAVLLVRGNEAEDDGAVGPDLARAAALDAAVVCYASARQVERIARALLDGGRAPGDPAALVYEGTTPAQQTVTASLAEIAGRALPDRTGLLVVGATVGLRERLRWYDTRPLFGRRIVVTRSRDQAPELMSALEALGAEALAMPTIRIAPPADQAPLEAACRAAQRFDWIVFTSANGVESFFRRYLDGRDIRDLKGVRICTVGPATRAAVERFGVRVDVVPAEYRGDAILGALARAGEISGRRILLPRAEIARERVGQELRGAGAEVVEVVAYRTLPERDPDARDVYRMLSDRRIDAVTFTSASTVRSFVRIIGAEQAADLLRGTIVAAIGPVTAEAARSLGLDPSVVPEEYTIPALVDALVQHFHGRRAGAPDT